MTPIKESNAGHLTIELGDNSKKWYKSIRVIKWDNIPPLAVLTGLNGSGKSQFLQALAYRLTQTFHNVRGDFPSMPIQMTEHIGIDEVAFLSGPENGFPVEQVNINNIHNVKQNFLQRISQSASHDITISVLRAKIQRQFGIFLTHPQQISQEMISKLPDDFMFMLDFMDVSHSIGYVFYGYNVRRANMLLDEASPETIVEKLGAPPWVVLNDALSATGFEYEIIPPSNNLLNNYQLRLLSTKHGTEIDINDLSSGEKLIMRMILWSYNCQINNTIPKLLLLDEPDAFLHPTLTRHFMDIVNDILVKKHGIRVIITTHSPSTVALAPEGSVFVMTREEPRIRGPVKKAEAISILTAGLVVVTPGTKFVFVEDDADVNFYTLLFSILTDKNQHPARPLDDAPSLIFLPASVRKGSMKAPGGRDVVIQLVSRFQSEPLNSMFFGMIDGDNGNIESQNIKSIHRYSIENYFCDPLIIFGVLLEEGHAPQIGGVDLTPGDEHKIRDLSNNAMSNIATYIVQAIKTRLIGTIDEGNFSVTFTNGKILTYPKWIKTYRGHDILSAAQQIYGQKLMTPPRLFKMMRRIRLIPVELAEIMKSIQQT